MVFFWTMDACSASRSATPNCQPERNPERNSENWSGARPERNSGFCRSANALALIFIFRTTLKMFFISKMQKEKGRRECSKVRKKLHMLLYILYINFYMFLFDHLLHIHNLLRGKWIELSIFKVATLTIVFQEQEYWGKEALLRSFHRKESTHFNFLSVICFFSIH